MSVEMGTRIIKVIEDVDFCFLGDWDMTDENLIMKFDPKHGTVIYVAGIIEGDPYSIMSLLEKRLQKLNYLRKTK